MVGLLLSLLAMGCATPSPNWYWHTETVTQPTGIADLLQRQPLGPSENIRNTTLGRTDALSQHLVQVRDREPLHVHRDHDLLVTIQQGHGSLRVGTNRLKLRTGDTVFIPKGVPHAFKNEGPGIAVALVTFTPPFDGRDMIPVGPEE